MALSMNHKGLINAIVRHMILLYEVLERDDVGDCTFLEPDWLVISWYMCLQHHHHGSTIASQAHACACLEAVSNEGLITKQIHH